MTDPRPVTADLAATAGLRATALGRLAAWGRWAERDWYDVPDCPGHGCFGTGYERWGAQTNQKYLAAMATLSALGPDADRDRNLARALAALRYELATHVSGDTDRVNGTRWGRHWLSALGVERMMHGMDHLEPHLADADRAGLRRVLLSEAQWACDEHERGPHHGIFGGRWAADGRNVPESNLWNGAILWRAATMYSDHERADELRERAHEFLVNGVSVPADADDDSVLAGRPVRERHAGANFFASYALDHHGYLNVGYMVICLSQAAMLHLDLTARGETSPQTLHHHQADLWAVTRRMVFGDGRLARIGGDSRVPYTYCQCYLVPTLLYAAEHLGDGHAAGLLAQQVALIGREQDAGDDDSFHGARLGPMAARNPYYYTRLESDQAVALSMLATHGARSADAPAPGDAEDFETSVAGTWLAPRHGAAVHRSPTRFASVAWRAYAGPQVLCVPPAAGDLADWVSNGIGRIDFLGHDEHQSATRRLLGQGVTDFNGGFLAAATIAEGDRNPVPEGLVLKHQATSHVAVAALPDGHTVLVLHRCVARYRVFTEAVTGLHLSVPNDCFNGHARRVASAAGERVLETPPTREELLDLGGRWACIDERLGAVGVYDANANTHDEGAPTLTLNRAADRRGGRYRGLFTEVIGFPCRRGLESHDAAAVILDVGAALVSGARPDEVQPLAAAAVGGPAAGDSSLREVTVTGLDGTSYRLAANLGDGPVTDPATRTAHEPGAACLFAGERHLATLAPHDAQRDRNDD